MWEDSKAAASLSCQGKTREFMSGYTTHGAVVLGHPDQALRICAEARLYADVSRHPFTEAMARTIACGYISFAARLPLSQARLTRQSHSAKSMSLCTI